MDKSKRVFEIAYYSWAKSEFAHEIENEFPLLRLFNNGAAAGFFEFSQQISKLEQFALAGILLKRFHTAAVEFLDEECSSEEERIRSRYDAFQLGFSAKDYRPLRSQDGRKYQYTKRNKLRQEIRAKFMEAVSKRYSGVLIINQVPELEIEMSINDWVVTTFFGFGRHETCLEYSHTLSVPFKGRDQPQFVVNHYVSLLAWLGISTQTKWNYIMDCDIDKVSDHAILLSQKFFDSAPGLLKDIGPKEG